MRTYENILHIDFESLYDREYSLSKMPTILYVRDARWKTLGVALAWNDDPAVYLSHDEFVEWAESVDWATTAICAHNAAFDGCVLTQQYGIYPSFYMCTASAARALLPVDSVALKKVAPLLGLGEKGDALVSGATQSTAALAEYAVNDVELSRGIYRMLYPMLAKDEDRLIDLTIQMAVEPVLELDQNVLVQVEFDASKERDDAIAASGYTEAQLASNQQFSAIVKGLGLTPPTKLSATTGEEVDAWGKSDDEFQSFMAEYAQYAHIWNARLQAKSTINQTRAKKFLEIARTGTMPMPMSFAAAKTGRWGGTDKLNCMNLPNKHKSNMRKSIVAPEGYRIVVVDSSQIELRVAAWLSGHEEMMATLFSGEDVYIKEACNQFNVTPEEVTKQQRQYGKLCVLGLNYGMGQAKFRKTAAAGPLGMAPIHITPEQAYSTVTKYRSAHAPIPKAWYELDAALHKMTLPGVEEKWGVVTLRHECIELPSGRYIQYFGLHQSENSGWAYGVDKKSYFIWGATCFENLCQAVARDIVAYQMLLIAEKYRVVLAVHDEVVYLAREEEADEALAYGVNIFAQVPEWAAGLITKGEGGYDVTYSK